MNIRTLIPMSLMAISPAYGEIVYKIDQTGNLDPTVRKFDLRPSVQWIARGGRLGHFVETKETAPSAPREVQESQLKLDSELRLTQSNALFTTLTKPTDTPTEVTPPREPARPASRLDSTKLDSCIQQALNPLIRSLTVSKLNDSVSEDIEILLSRYSRAFGIPCGESLGLGRFDAMDLRNTVRFFWIRKNDPLHRDVWDELFFAAFSKESPLEYRQALRNLWSVVSTNWILTGQTWSWDYKTWIPLLPKQEIDPKSIAEGINQVRHAFKAVRGIK